EERAQPDVLPAGRQQLARQHAPVECCGVTNARVEVEDELLPGEATSFSEERLSVRNEDQRTEDGCCIHRIRRLVVEVAGADAVAERSPGDLDHPLACIHSAVLDAARQQVAAETAVAARDVQD